MNQKLQMIADDSADKFKTLFKDASDEIEKLMVQAVAESQERDVDPIAVLSFQVKMHLDKNKLAHALSFSRKHKFESISEMPDPEQMKLPGVVNSRPETAFGGDE